MSTPAGPITWVRRRETGLWEEMTESQLTNELENGHLTDVKVNRTINNTLRGWKGELKSAQQCHDARLHWLLGVARALMLPSGDPLDALLRQMKRKLVRKKKNKEDDEEEPDDRWERAKNCLATEHQALSCDHEGLKLTGMAALVEKASREQERLAGEDEDEGAGASVE